MPTLKIPLRSGKRSEGPLVDVEVWDCPCKGIDEGEEAAQWFTIYLNKHAPKYDEDASSMKFRLVRVPDVNERTVPPAFIQKDNNAVQNFNDAFPFLLTSEESLEDLNTRVKEKQIPMKRFRPNIVGKATSGGKPFMEDTWKTIKAGKVSFWVCKMCTRCKLTTVNPENGEFDGQEPLKTLKEFRKGLLFGKDEVCFGQNLIHKGMGELKVGMEFEIIE